MKDMGEARKILGIKILRYRDSSSLSINQLSYCGKVLKRFNLSNAKLVTLLIAQHFKLFSANSPKFFDLEHQNQMSTVPYNQYVGSLIYLMISTKLDLSY